MSQHRHKQSTQRQEERPFLPQCPPLTKPSVGHASKGAVIRITAGTSGGRLMLGHTHAERENRTYGRKKNQLIETHLEMTRGKGTSRQGR